jgi:putative FmdB family regulatory protein
MPTYEYECQKCGHRFDEFQSMTAKPLVRCPKCKGKLKRLIGAGAGFLFKGSGFYATDYRSSSYQEKQKGDAPKSESKGESGAKAEAGSPSEGGGKEKPAAKPAAPAKSETKTAPKKKSS